MTNLIVRVDHASFSYRIKNASASNLKQAFINRLKRIESDVVVDAIHEISFELKTGEVLGIIGRNGAGKSTLLKLVAGILPPSYGSVKVNGKVAPLIELGAGFSPELSGEENIELFGVLLGNNRKEMKEHVREIAEWAGLVEQIKLPLRTYSTGMLARLGFAVATFQQSQLLIIDEVLSVGDSDFQKKSLARVEELISNGSATILVSHDLPLIRERSTKVLWLEHGKQAMLGDPEVVLNAYKAN
jgi:ABC-type polysaccharide/polyol phosphate transport system ATPase subunit